MNAVTSPSGTSGALANTSRLQELLHRDIAPLGLLGQEPLADELVELVLEKRVALLLELGELRLGPLLDLLDRDDLVADPRRRRRALARRGLLGDGHSRPDTRQQNQEPYPAHPASTAHGLSSSRASLFLSLARRVWCPLP